MTNELSLRRETQPWSLTIINESFEPRVSLFGKGAVRNTRRVRVHDIRRQGTAQHLVPCLIDGLKTDQRELPTLLLWNECGLALFDAVLNSPDYYPAKREWSLLVESAAKIASSISSGDRLIELGAGNMKKTALILQALHVQHKHIQYIACDVDRTSLMRYLRELQAVVPANVSNIRVQGLVGTYEDCAAWLKRNGDYKANSHTSLMWLGNSMANFTPSEASEYIRSFLSSGASMIIALDGCQDREQIARSYEGESNRDFVFNGLFHANDLLGTKAFDVNDWDFAGRWNDKMWMHESFYVAKRDLELTVCGERYQFKKEDTMRSIRSGKWPKIKVMEICHDAGGVVVEDWMNQEGSYGVYLVKKN